MNIFLLIVCIVFFFLAVLEAFVLVKDRGRVARYMNAAREMVHREGLLKTFVYSVRKIILHFEKKRKQKEKMESIRRDFNNYSDDFVHVAFEVPGGLGDYIVSKKVLEEILENENCVVDIYCGYPTFCEAIYGGMDRVKLYNFNYDDFEFKYIYYDLALVVEHFIHVLNMNEERLSVAPKLYESAKYIRDKWDSLYVKIPEQHYRERIQFERCKIVGLDRWTELRMGKAFKIENKKVHIPLLGDFFDEYKALNLNDKKYITINYGADAMIKGKKQLKLWPKENFEKFCEIMKQKYPEIEIVQLGAVDAEKIIGADIFILGRSLELTKWILKNSLCHIDLEGGLVHLATQLETKCIVCFGPTPVHMYGYEQNINIVSEFCSNCMGLVNWWAYNCSKGCDGLCMKKIEPKTVFDAFVEEFGGKIK